MSPFDGSMADFEPVEFSFEPGIFADLTAWSAKNKYIYSDKIRFRYSFPETVGGCTNYLGATTFDGVGRALKTWSRLDGVNVIAAGTHKKVEVVIAATKYDITPFDYLASGTLGNNPFTTTAGSAVVSVNHTAHGRVVGDIVEYANGPVVDDIDTGAYAWEVLGITDADNYTVTMAATGAAGAAGTGGAGVTYSYTSLLMAANQLATVNGSATVTVTHANHGRTVGSQVVIVGAASFNSVIANGTWTVATVPTANTYTFTYTSAATGTGPGGGAGVRETYVANIGDPTGVNMRLPSLQNWGQDLVFTMGKHSRIYRWDSTAPTKRARRIPRAPTANFILVSADDQSLIAFGANGDDMDIKWSDQDDYTTWLEEVDNTAGERRLLRGSKLVAAIQVTGGHLVFSDVGVHIMNFIGGDSVFGVNYIASTAILGQNAVCEKDGIAYWMGGGNFYNYDGRSNSMSCSVKRYVFKTTTTVGQETPGIDVSESVGVCAGINDEFNEVWFFYPTDGATYNDAYATFNYRENVWAIGTWQRTAWMDDDILQAPFALDASGVMYQHEYGTDDNGVPLGAILRTGDCDAPSITGNQVILGQRVILDAIMTGNYYFSVKARDSQGDTYRVSGPVMVTDTTKETWLSYRGRRIAFEWSTPTVALEELETEQLIDDFIATEDGETILLDGVIKDQTLNLATTWRLGVQMPDVIADGVR